ncbi:hypothetical protein [Paraburkholderia eburnea]|nr:hypothetical protein [Paraburkholderia eburnea]
MNTAVSFVLGLALHLIAIWRGWRLPAFDESDGLEANRHDALHE